MITLICNTSKSIEEFSLIQVRFFNFESILSLNWKKYLHIFFNFIILR